MRELIRGILSSDPEIEVVGAVCDQLAARQKIKECDPDGLTLDIEMLRMDGITNGTKTDRRIQVDGKRIIYSQCS